MYFMVQRVIDSKTFQYGVGILHVSNVRCLFVASVKKMRFEFVEEDKF